MSQYPVCGTPILSTEDLLWAPKKKAKGKEFEIDENVKKTLVFENPSSPVKEYVRGWYETRSSLAPCKCYVGIETCNQVPCVCPRKKKFNEDQLYCKKKVNLKCTCPTECKELQSAQELF